MTGEIVIAPGAFGVGKSTVDVVDYSTGERVVLGEATIDLDFGYVESIDLSDLGHERVRALYGLDRMNHFSIAKDEE